ncbi:MAG: hypothetical protein ACHQO8_14210, partial [Vicinamibacterales bacterium]
GLRQGLAGVTGLTTHLGRRVACLAGSPTVTDAGEALFGVASPDRAPVTCTRHALSFFQGNRFLAGALVRRVVESASGDDVADLYAGVGLFALALAARGARVVAVEGDPWSGADLSTNAAAWGDRIQPVRSTVEAVLAEPPATPPGVVIIDPPRTGLSSAALAGLIGWRPPRIVYVSCDPPTLARDAAHFLASGYRLQSIDAFDLFPNTPHVETVAVLTNN